jgi:hypothetical protein
MPFRIEDEARKLGANYVQAGLFKAYAIRDNQLITGQQQYSGTKVAHLVIESLGVERLACAAGEFAVCWRTALGAFDVDVGQPA